MVVLSSDVVIIGAGPSGLISALLCGRTKRVLLIEKGGREKILGKRILVSGNGRANFFNEDLLHEEFYSSSLFAPVKDIVFSSSHHYAKEFLSYLEKELSFPIRKEGKLYYPYFLKSECLQNVLLQELRKRKNVEILWGEVESISTPSSSLMLVDEEGEKKKIIYQDLVLAVGGKSLDRENIKNDFLKEFTFYPFSPSLCPVKVKEKIPSYLNKNRLRGRLDLFCDDKKIYSEEGELLFKPDGISGICVFNSTIYLLEAQRKRKKAKFRYEFTYLDEPCSYSALPSFLRRYQSEEKKELGKMVFTYQELYPFAQSQISYGGILLSEINKETMALKKNPHIYLAGEMLDQNFPCGGYNMGMAFIEGYKIGRRLEDEFSRR